LVSLTQGPSLRAFRHPLAEASGLADMGEAHCSHTVEIPIEPSITRSDIVLEHILRKLLPLLANMKHNPELPRELVAKGAEHRKVQLILLGRNDPGPASREKSPSG
jgi:hypothetical protein